MGGISYTGAVQNKGYAKQNATIEAIQEEARQALLSLEEDMEEDLDIDADPDEEGMGDPEEGMGDPDEEGAMGDPGAPEAPEAVKEEAASEKEAPSTAANLNDDDAKCYSSRYQDIDAMLDPKAHYSTTGIT